VFFKIGITFTFIRAVDTFKWVLARVSSDMILHGLIVMSVIITNKTHKIIITINSSHGWAYFAMV
jgi:hypothetical protein